MNLPPAISREETLRLIDELRAATSSEDTERLERKIMEGNLRFCAYQARRYKQPELELDDLVAVAAAALLDAVRNFNPEKSNHFAAYARRCIRRDLATMVRREGSAVRLPREPRRGEAERGRVAAATPQSVSLDQVERVTRGPQKRIAAVADADETGITLHQRAAPPRYGISAQAPRAAVEHSLETENPEDGLLAGIDAERMAKRVAALPEREATVVRMRFGLDGVAPHELAEIGVVLNVSKQRVQVILDKALATLRGSFKVAA